MWRGATTKKATKGYADAVLNNHKTKQTNLPPTSMVTDTRSRKPPSSMSSKNIQRAPLQENKITNNLGKAMRE
jgi:hypothetical protein